MESVATFQPPGGHGFMVQRRRARATNVPHAITADQRATRRQQQAVPEPAPENMGADVQYPQMPDNLTEDAAQNEPPRGKGRSIPNRESPPQHLQQSQHQNAKELNRRYPGIWEFTNHMMRAYREGIEAIRAVQTREPFLDWAGHLTHSVTSLISAAGIFSLNVLRNSVYVLAGVICQRPITTLLTWFVLMNGIYWQPATEAFGYYARLVCANEHVAKVCPSRFTDLGSDMEMVFNADIALAGMLSQAEQRAFMSKEIFELEYGLWKLYDDVVTSEMKCKVDLQRNLTEARDLLNTTSRQFYSTLHRVHWLAGDMNVIYTSTMEKVVEIERDEHSVMMRALQQLLMPGYLHTSRQRLGLQHALRSMCKQMSSKLDKLIDHLDQVLGVIEKLHHVITQIKSLLGVEKKGDFARPGYVKRACMWLGWTGDYVSFQHGVRVIKQGFEWSDKARSLLVNIRNHANEMQVALLDIKSQLDVAGDDLEVEVELRMLETRMKEMAAAMDMYAKVDRGEETIDPGDE